MSPRHAAAYHVRLTQATGVCAQLLVPGLTVDKVVVLCILVNAYTTYPCLVLVIQARDPNPLPWMVASAQRSRALPEQRPAGGTHLFRVSTPLGTLPRSSVVTL